MAMIINANVEQIGYVSVGDSDDETLVSEASSDSEETSVTPKIVYTNSDSVEKDNAD